MMINKQDTINEVQTLDLVCRQLSQIVTVKRQDFQSMVMNVINEEVSEKVNILDRINQIRTCLLGALDELHRDPEEEDSEEFVFSIIRDTRPKIEALLVETGCTDDEESCPPTLRDPSLEESGIYPVADKL